MIYLSIGRLYFFLSSYLIPGDSRGSHGRGKKADWSVFGRIRNLSQKWGYLCLTRESKPSYLKFIY